MGAYGGAGSVASRSGDHRDQATYGFRPGLGRATACENRSERVAQVVLRRGGARDSRFVLVVDASLVTHAIIGVEQEDLRSSRGLESPRKLLISILDQRKGKLLVVAKLLDLGERVLAIAVDPHESHAPLRELLVKFAQSRSVESHQRAFRTEKTDDFPVCIGQRKGAVFHVP